MITNTTISSIKVKPALAVRRTAERKSFMESGGKAINDNRRMVGMRNSNLAVRAVTALLWAAAAASAVAWGLKLGAPAPQGQLGASSYRPAPPADPAMVARLLGQVQGSAPSAAAAPPLSSRFSLVGVVADRAQQGAALIAVDGRPAKPFRVGSVVDEGLVLQSVQQRRAVLAATVNGPAVVTLELPQQQR
jgi:general secretion pathway protein C